MPVTGLHLQLIQASGRHPAAHAEAPAAIDRCSLEIKPGEHVAIIGPSGAGKTTLLQLLAASLKPSAGQVLINNQDIWTLSTRALQRLRGSLFYAPQSPPLPPRQRVITALLAGQLPAQTLWQSLAQLIYPRDVAKAHDALAAFDLSEKLWDRVDRLSGGERQRVGLARGLLTPASLWLIDEPLSALDPTRAQQAIQTLTEQARARGVTLVTTLHQVEVARTQFPRIIGLRDGQLVFDLPAANLAPEQLASLYAQHEDELTGLAASHLDTPPTPEPARIIHCR